MGHEATPRIQRSPIPSPSHTHTHIARTCRPVATDPGTHHVSMISCIVSSYGRHMTDIHDTGCPVPYVRTVSYQRRTVALPYHTVPYVSHRSLPYGTVALSYQYHKMRDVRSFGNNNNNKIDATVWWPPYVYLIFLFLVCYCK